MEKVEPNSFEAVAAFILYICYQDKEVSNLEINQFESDLNILKKLYLDIYGEYIAFDFKTSLKKVMAILKQNDAFLSPELSTFEKNYFNQLLTDKKLKDVALLEAKHAASADTFHKKEKQKFNQWLELWS